MLLRKAIVFVSLCLLSFANIPAGAQTDTTYVSQPREPEYIIHTVRWYESINDLSRKYNVPVEVIVEVNGLSKPKIKSRQKIKIPADLEQYYRYKEAVSISAAVQASSQTPVQAAPPQEGQSQEGQPPVEQVKKDKVKAVVLLPLGATDGSSDIYLDFYSGALMAAKDLGESGISAELDIVDLASGAISEEDLEKISTADMAIGPVTKSALESLIATGIKTPVISPLDPKAACLADSSANFIQAPSPASRQYSDLALWLAEEREPQDNVLLISESGVTLSDGMTELKAILDEHYINFGTFSYSILQGRGIIDGMSASLRPDVTNRVVVLSENEAFVNDVVRNLNLLNYNKFNVVLYSASKIRSFETIDVENLHSVNLHVCSSYFIDYDDPRVKRFLLVYRALFNSEPNQFAFQGYDVAGFFIKACHDLGSRWPTHLDRGGINKMLQADFRLERNPEGGFINTGIRRVIYGSDYSVKEFQR